MIGWPFLSVPYFKDCFEYSLGEYMASLTVRRSPSILCKLREVVLVTIASVKQLALTLSNATRSNSPPDMV